MPDLGTAAGQFDYLTGGCIDVVREDELRVRLEKAIATGRGLVVKVGFDPSSADIHLGHVVLIRKMRQFQDCGHRIVFVVGDFTAMIGDPTGRSKTRPQLSREEIAANAATYRKQAARILDDARTSFRYNSEWLEPLGSVGLIRLAAKYNVARMLERRDFRQRFDSGQSIAIHEFLYPLAQAYDSVALEADVELGGTDQLFNLNVGRDIMPEFGLAPQIVMTTPLLEGLDGIEKMSKSLGNYVAIEDPPGEMFGKLMSISDDLMWKYWLLVGDAPRHVVEHARGLVESASGGGARTGEGGGDTTEGGERAGESAGRSGAPGGRAGDSNGHAGVPGGRAGESSGRGGESGGRAGEARGKGSGDRASTAAGTGTEQDLLEALGASSLHPREMKAALARRIVAVFHGEEAARRAQAEFDHVFANREAPTEVEEVVRPLDPEGVWLPKLLADLGLVKSNGEAIRLIQQGGIEVEGARVTSKEHRLSADRPGAYLIKVGKRRYVRIRFA